MKENFLIKLSKFLSGEHICTKLNTPIKVSMQESDSWGSTGFLTGPANHFWALMLVLFEVAGKVPAFRCVWVSCWASQGEAGWLGEKWGILGWTEDFICQAKILTNLLNFQTKIFFLKSMHFFFLAKFCWGLCYWGMNWDGYVELIYWHTVSEIWRLAEDVKPTLVRTF